MSKYETVSKEANESAISGIEVIRGLFKKAGFKVSTKKYSALYAMYFKRGDTEYSLDGWHGDGSYGFGKSVFALYGANAKPVIPELKFDHSKAIEGPAQEEFIQAVIAFIKANI